MQTLVVSVILQKGAPNSNTGTTNRIQSFAYRRHRVEALGLHLVWSLSSSPPQWFHSASTIKFNSRQKTQKSLCIGVHCFYQKKLMNKQNNTKICSTDKTTKKFEWTTLLLLMAEKKVRSNQPIKDIEKKKSTLRPSISLSVYSFSIILVSLSGAKQREKTHAFPISADKELPGHLSQMIRIHRVHGYQVC